MSTAIADFILWPSEHLSPELHSVLWGGLTAVATQRVTLVALRDCDLSPNHTPRLFAILAAVLGTLFTWLMLTHGIQEIPEVRPTPLWKYLRIPFHLSLIVNLLAATATDLRSFYLSTRLMLWGILWGIGWATLSGDLQLCHIWVDWNAEIPQIQGPYLPAWLSAYPHWHGFVWSVTGAVCGAGLATLVRGIGNCLLARSTLGTGDIYLQAMIGATLGWQPTVVAFLLAPLVALTAGAVAKLGFNRPALPYGPFLAAGALIVLFGWREIWMLEIQLAEALGEDDRRGMFAIRRFFGDGVALLLVAGIALGGLIVLLGLLRLYHLLPTHRGRDASTNS